LISGPLGSRSRRGVSLRVLNYLNENEVPEEALEQENEDAEQN
jgi:hypothetical protein